MRSFIGLLLGLSATVCWGSFYVVGRWLFGEGEGELNVFLFNFLRFVMAAAALTPLLLVRRNRELVKRALARDLKPFLLITVVGVVLESYLVFYALNFTTAARCSLMANFSPVATVIFAFFLHGEKISKWGITGMIVGFAGIVMAGISQGGDMYAATDWRTFIGDAMALASGLCWAFFTAYGVEVSDRYGGAVCMLVCFFLGALLMLPLQFFMVTPAEAVNIPLRVWGGMIYTGMVTLAFANGCYYAALRYIRAGVLGAFGYLSAGITFTLSIILLGEHFSGIFIISVLLILGGMLLMMYRPGRN
ncbi:MAG: DMT family transporter [Lentisphaeria bacterium]|nr:DMT family transporter [Lentisphaeria bacterium]